MCADLVHVEQVRAESEQSLDAAIVSIQEYVGDGFANELVASSNFVLSTMTLDGLIRNIELTAVEHVKLTNRIELAAAAATRSTRDAVLEELDDEEVTSSQQHPGGLSTHFNS